MTTKRRNFLKSSTVRAHQGRRFQNPYFKKPHRSLVRKLLPVFFVLVLFAGGIGYVIYGPLLRVENVSISGLTTIPEETVQDYVWQELNHQGLRILPKNHRWFVPTDDLSQQLMQEFDLSKAEIAIDGGQITIQVEERILEFVWRVDRSFYFVDLEGVITRELRQNERNSLLERLNMELDPIEDGAEREFAPLQPTMPIIEDKTLSEIKVGDRVLPAGASENILAFDLGLRQLALTPLIYESESRIDPWFRVVIDSPYQILFDGAGDPAGQLTALSVTLQEYEGLVIENYIDVRFPNRAFVK